MNSQGGRNAGGGLSSVCLYIVIRPHKKGKESSTREESKGALGML